MPTCSRAGRPEDLLAFERRTRRSELIHLAGLAVAGLFLVIGIAGSGAVLSAGIAVFAANFHCFVLQRYNRIRIHRVLARAGRATRRASHEMEEPRHRAGNTGQGA